MSDLISGTHKKKPTLSAAYSLCYHFFTANCHIHTIRSLRLFISKNITSYSHQRHIKHINCNISLCIGLNHHILFIRTWIDHLSNFGKIIGPFSAKKEGKQDERTIPHLIIFRIQYLFCIPVAFCVFCVFVCVLDNVKCWDDYEVGQRKKKTSIGEGEDWLYSPEYIYI